MSYMNQYVFHRIYNTPFGDQVPLVIANALHVNIGIISKCGNVYKTRVIHPNTSDDILGNVLISQFPDHNDGTILKSIVMGAIYIYMDFL